MATIERELAFKSIYNVLYNGSYSNLEIDKVLKNNDINNSFYTRLVLGVIEKKITLDYFLNLFIDKTKPKIKIVFYIGLYQILFMDSIPNNVAVNESIEILKDNGLSYYVSFVNAIFRKILNSNISLNDIDEPYVKYSVPKNLLNMWKKHYGELGLNAILDSVNCANNDFIVINSKKTNANEFNILLNKNNIDYSQLDNYIYKIHDISKLIKTNLYTEGLFHVQDYSCYKAINSLKLFPNVKVLDLCSSPGGKSFTLASLVNDNAKIISCDNKDNRVELINRNIERLEYNSINTCLNDATVYNSNLGKFDIVICDVPCSGFGIIRKKPEIKYKNLDEVFDLIPIQKSILNTSKSYLNDNGQIIYSTCTLNKKENEYIVEEFLITNDDFKLVKEETIFPSSDYGEGFYYAILEKK